MSKPEQRWSIRKLALTAVGLTGGAALFVVLSFVVPEPVSPGDAGPLRPTLTVPAFLLIAGIALAMLAALAFGFLIYRYRESRIPVWERKKPRKRRRRARR